MRDEGRETTVAISSLIPHPSSVTVAGGYEEFERGIAAALSSDTSERRRQRSDAMRAETWERKVAQVSAHVMRVKAQKQGSGVRGRGTGPAESKTAFDVDLAALTPDPRPLTPGE